MRKDHTVAELAQLVAKAYQVREASYIEGTYTYKLSVYDAVKTLLPESDPLYPLVVYCVMAGEPCDILDTYSKNIAE